MISITRRCTDEDKVRRCTLLEEFSNVGRHTLVIWIVVGRLKIGALILKDL